MADTKIMTNAKRLGRAAVDRGFGAPIACAEVDAAGNGGVSSSIESGNKFPHSKMAQDDSICVRKPIL